MIQWKMNMKVLKKKGGLSRKLLIFSSLFFAFLFILSLEKIVHAQTATNPATVGIVWEAETYTPPFYKGKALFTNESTIKLVALPNFPGYKAGDLIYTWKKNTTVLEDQSGLGKNVAEITASVIRTPFDIVLDVSSPDNKYSAETIVSLQPQFPQILLYEDYPALGTWFENALGSQQTINADEMNISAMPYFFSTASRYDTNLNTTWTVNGNPVANTQNQPYITVKGAGSGESNALLGVQMNEGDKFLQLAQQSLNITFNPQPQ